MVYGSVIILTCMMIKHFYYKSVGDVAHNRYT